MNNLSEIYDDLSTWNKLHVIDGGTAVFSGFWRIGRYNTKLPIWSYFILPNVELSRFKCLNSWEYAKNIPNNPKNILKLPHFA